jgi:hypothetical protein
MACDTIRMSSSTMSLEEVAAECRRKPDGFRRIWRRLHAEQGFPCPLPGLGLVWSRRLVMAWIEGAAMARRPANDDAPTDMAGVIAAQRAMLREEMAKR